MLRFASLMLVAGLLFCASCGEDDSTPAPQNPQPTGNLTDVSGCKQFMRNAGDDKTKSCIRWDYNVAKKELTLVHVNAGFNCCPKAINATISVDGTVMVIAESEVGPDCRCNCLYDLTMRVNDVAPARYVVQVIEPLRSKDEDALEFSMDLSTQTTGEFCVPRFMYPWG